VMLGNIPSFFICIQSLNVMKNITRFIVFMYSKDYCP
jgi:hypothetical protein